MAEGPATAAPASAGREGGGEPAISVILVTDGLDLISEVLEHLRAQTAADRMELLVVTPAGTIPADPPELAGFRWSQVVESDSRTSPPAARVAGIHVARAPVVVFAETHCFPEPDWAEALLAAHEGPWTAVGPEINNENPERGVSWGNLFVDYSSWVGPETSHEVDDLPGHNSSYKRQALLDYGDDLDALFASESIMHWDMRERGLRMYVEADAKVMHRNITQMRAGLLEHFHNGRCFGALRSRDWSLPHRALYVLASPVIPLVRFQRIVRDVRAKGYGGSILARALPTVALKLIAHAAGEMTGYATGPGDAVHGMATYELDRDTYVEA